MLPTTLYIHRDKPAAVQGDISEELGMYAGLRQAQMGGILNETRQDNPTCDNQITEYSWKDGLAKFTEFQNIMLSSDATIKVTDIWALSIAFSDQFQKNNITRVTGAVLDVLKTSNGEDSLNLKFLQEIFDKDNREVLLYQSSLFQDVYSDRYNLRCNTISQSPADTKTRQLSAKLDCLYGVTQPLISVRGEPIELHAHARAKVYDLRTYTADGTFWGPFLDDGTCTVDWEKVEAIMIVLVYNLQHVVLRHSLQSELLVGLPLRWIEPWRGVSPNSFVPPKGQKEITSTGLDKLDPFGVSGTYLRVCIPVL